MWTKVFFSEAGFWNILTSVWAGPSRHTFTKEPQHKDAGRDVEVWKSCVFFYFLFQVLHLQITRLESSSDCMFSFFFFLYKGWFTGSERREDSLLSCEGSPDLTDPVSLKVDLLPDWRRDGAPFFYLFIYLFFFFVQNTTAIPPSPVLLQKSGTLRKCPNPSRDCMSKPRLQHGGKNIALWSPAYEDMLLFWICSVARNSFVGPPD